ncbi:MAG: transcriptional repressor [Epsilonproteobacteria bacterium]|nr:transcriptional repressor [Campylobacterota bacterium]NPA57347.1 transcriptional repressor [Campylobacterota bacterium]
MKSERERGLREYIEELKRRVKERGLKHSQQREEILTLLFHARRHLTPEEIYNQLKREKSTIGLATVYRTLAFLEQENIVNSISFGSEGKRYELNRGGHHDHMICIRCGKIVEFYNEELEALQEEIARREGFVLITHQLNLYGLCPQCQKRR